MKQNTKRNIRLLLINLVAMIAVVVIIPYIVLLWIDSYTHHGETYLVPNVCGMQLEEAKELLRKSNLDLEIIDYKYKKGAAENEVVEQMPVANARVKQGRKIMLTMSSKSKPVAAIPSVIDNCSLREAEARLKAAGFVIADVVTIEGEKDWVYAVKYNGRELVNGENVPREAKLVIVVGSGEKRVVDEAVIDEGYFE